MIFKNELFSDISIWHPSLSAALYMRVLTNQTAFSSGAWPPQCLVAANVRLSQMKPDQRPGFLHPHPAKAINGDIPESVLGPKTLTCVCPQVMKLWESQAKRKMLVECKCPVRALGGRSQRWGRGYVGFEICLED